MAVKQSQCVSEGASVKVQDCLVLPSVSVVETANNIRKFSLSRKCFDPICSGGFLLAFSS